MKTPRTILISRTDSIGDVVLTLPMAGVIKEKYPNDRILFLGRDYTKDVVALSSNVDEFISYDELLATSPKQKIENIRLLTIDICIHVFPVKEIASLMKKAKVKMRIGTTNRLYHLYTCNELVRLSRKNSDLHESQLNLKLLAPIGITRDFSLKEISTYYGFKNTTQLSEEFTSLIKTDKRKIILHPKSKGSAKEWGLENFGKLINFLSERDFQVFISGTKEEGDLIRDFIEEHPSAIDLTGRFSLNEFISFINECDAMVAASTGPLHIASALGKRAIGIYSPKRPIHPGRWMPVGSDANYVVKDENCDKCKKNKDCDCITEIDIMDVYNKISP